MLLVGKSWREKQEEGEAWRPLSALSSALQKSGDRQLSEPSQTHPCSCWHQPRAAGGEGNPAQQQRCAGSPGAIAQVIGLASPSTAPPAPHT